MHTHIKLWKKNFTIQSPIASASHYKMVAAKKHVPIVKKRMYFLPSCKALFEHPSPLLWTSG